MKITKWKISICSYILIGILGSSCTKVNDSEAPQMSNIRINMNDTVHWNNTVIQLNTSPNSDTDTLTDKKHFLLWGRFKDNKSLSSFFCSLTHAPVPIENTDTCYFFNSAGTDIFGQTAINIQGVRIDSIPDSVKVRNFQKSITNGLYVLKIKCTDKNGNEAFAERKINILNRKSIYEAKSKR